MPERPSPYELQLTEHAGPTTTGDNIDGKKTLNYVWNPATSQWVRSQNTMSFLSLFETATGGIINASDAPTIAAINANGLPGYSTLPSTTLTTMVGNNVTNDQPALKNLVAYLGPAYTATGQPWIIYCPPGIYSMRDNGTVWTSGVSLIGAGPKATRFVLSNPVNTTNPTPLATYTTSQGASTSAPLIDCTFANFEVDGSGVSLASYNTGAKALVLQYMLRANFYNLYIHDCGATGLGCDFLQDSTINKVLAQNNGRLNNGTQAGGAGIGIGIGGWGSTNLINIERTSITNCTTTGNGTHGIFVELQNSSWTPPKGIRIENCHSEGNRYGISDWGADGLIVTGNQLLNNLQNGFYVSASGVGSVAGKNGRFTNNICDGNAVNGVSVGDTNRYEVIDNRVTNNGNHGVVATNIVNAQSVGIATLNIKDNNIYGNGYCGIRFDALLNNPFIHVNSVYDNGIRAAASGSNSGGTVTYTALTLTDTSVSWTTNSQIGKTVTVGSQTAIVQSNTSTVLTLWPYAANQTTAWSSGTPASGTAYSFPAAPTDRAGITFNNTTNHPVMSLNRYFDDQSPRIQPYGILTTASGTITNSWTVANDMLGNLTASFNFTTAPSGGVWEANNGMSAGNVTSPATMLTDGPAQYSKLNITTGSNAAIGTGTLSSGTATISTTAVTASSIIILTDTSNGANLGTLSVGTKTAGTSFVVNSSNVLDAATFNWLIVN